MPANVCSISAFDVAALWAENGGVSTSANEPVSPPEGTTRRQFIVNTALSLMAQNGVTGTSMRDLATATGLNVASLYHYFPSKRDLLVAVLDDRGFVADLATPSPPALSSNPATALGDLLTDILRSMLDVEDFIRLMLGEVLRGDETATAVGSDLFAATQASLEHWLATARPDLCADGSRPALARVLRSLLIGLFFEHVAGVLDEGTRDPAEVFRDRAVEAASFLDPQRADPHPG